VENRLVSQSQTVGGCQPNSQWSWALNFGYDPWGKRVTNCCASNTGQIASLYTFYGINGKRLATFQATVNDDTTYTFALQGSNLYFGGILMQVNGVWVSTDRLGSVRANSNGEQFAYYPYGQERTSTPDQREKFGTYFRDGVGKDYADQRYYNQNGSFWSPDPSYLNIDFEIPQSWNMYAYADEDPVNFNDPTGEARSFCEVYPLAPRCWPGGGAAGGGGDGPPGGGAGGAHCAFTGCGDSGGGGGPEPPATPVDITTDNLARGVLDSRLKDFGRSNCNKVLGDVIEDYTTKGFTGEVNIAEFYNITNPNVSSLTQNQVSGNGNPTSLGTSIPYGNAAKTISGSAGTAILLGANFFSNADATYQGNVLLHDSEIFANFASDGLSNPNGDTEDISAWLSTDCKSTPSSITWWSHQ
jgi:RHS repeat-associated protein